MATADCRQVQGPIYNIGQLLHCVMPILIGLRLYSLVIDRELKISKFVTFTRKRRMLPFSREYRETRIFRANNTNLGTLPHQRPNLCSAAKLRFN